MDRAGKLADRNARRFKPHPIPQQRQVDIWSVSGAMMERHSPQRNRDEPSRSSTELQREETAQMSLD